MKMGAKKICFLKVGVLLSIAFLALFGCIHAHAKVYADNLTNEWIDGVYYCSYMFGYADARLSPESNNYENLIIKSQYNGVPVKEVRNSWSNFGYDCKSVTIESGVQFINQDVFHDWKNLEWVQIPVTVESICQKDVSQGLIEYTPFEGCDSFKYLYYEGTREEWEKVDRPDKINYTIVYLGDGDIPNKAVIKELTEDGEKKLSNKAVTQRNVKVQYSGYQAKMYYSVAIDKYPAEANTLVTQSEEIIFSEEGFYYVVVSNSFTTAAEYYFHIDRTPPKCTLKTSQEEGFGKDNHTNGNVQLTWEETSPLISRIKSLDGRWEGEIGYYNGEVVYNEGKYVIRICDAAGNESIYEFCIDRTPPTGTLINVDTGGYAKEDVKCYIPDQYDTATLDGSPYSNMSIISTEGSHEIIITDRAGNSTTYSFFIDKTAPEITLTTTQSGGFRADYYTNGDVTVKDDDAGGSGVVGRTLNGQNNMDIGTLTAQGNYVYEVSDRAGNKSSVTFTILKTKPSGTLTTSQSGGFQQGNNTNGNVTFSWTELSWVGKSSTATLNGSAYVKNKSVTAEGSYKILLEDPAGNTVSYSFTIDKTAPVISLSTTQSGGFRTGNYTNGNVTVKDDGDAGGSGVDTRTINSQSCGKNTTHSAEGRYTFLICDIAGNTASVTFTIDTTAPTGTLATTQSDGFKAGNFTNGNVTFSWSDSEATAKLNSGVYQKAQSVTVEGSYTIELSDIAGNYCNYSFTIDKTLPVFSVSVGKGVHTNGNVTVAFSDNTPVTGKYGHSESLALPIASNGFVSGHKFETEGNYSFLIVDAAGNSASYDFIIDKTAPVVDPYSEYINTVFTMSAQDRYGSVAAWEYRFNGEQIIRVNAPVVTIGGSETANGVWESRAIDELGNTSAWCEVRYAQRNKFGNSDGIFNSYTTPTYYVVSLSQKNYVSCFGSYTFSEFEYALRYATQKEWECRVIGLDGGKSWNYVSPTNENVRQIYSDCEELDTVIDKYARRNVSERRVVGQNGSVLNNPTNADGVTCADALTCQIGELPPLLNEFADCRGMIAYIGYSLAMPKSIVDGNKSTAYIRYLSDGILIREGAEYQFDYGVPLKNVIKEQGWYMVREQDTCGNEERYLVYIDLQQPDLYAKVTYGSGNGEEIYFSQSYIDANTAAMRYISFELAALSDNVDEFTMLAVSGKNLNEQYIWGDELPVLSYENGYYGAYDITVYDRSRNVLTFTVYIAGEAPSVRHSSLSSDISCTFKVQLNDSYNEITDIKFYKIHFNGDEERIYADSFDTPVSSENLTYKMTVGGKYVFVLTDLYGRIVRTIPYFYMKGLPVATFKGVKEGGLTKNDVTITYDTNATVELSIWRNGDWVEASVFELYQGVSNNTIRITAGSDTTGEYHVLLYVTEDRNLFTEYKFEIDGIPPIVRVVTENGATVTPETVTTQNFYVTWEESGYKAYFKKQSAISDMQYARETLISAAGTYVFTVYDEAHNESTFSVTLDNSVNYTLEGAYVLLEDGSYLTRGNFVFTLNEPWSVFEVETSNGITVTNGQKLDTDGTYRIHAVDMFGNEMSQVLIIDKLPPVAKIATVGGSVLEDGARTKEAFLVSCEEENVAISYAYQNGGFAAYDSAAVNTVGLHTFRLMDRVGNVATVAIIIDREVSYHVNGSYIESEGVLFSRSWMQVEVFESFLVFSITSENGNTVKNTDKIVTEGRYRVKIRDLAGNVVDFEFEIDKTPPTLMMATQSGTKLSNGARTKEAFLVSCEEPDSEITYSLNGAKSVSYKGELLNDVGNYELSAKDKLGNISTVTIVIDREVRYHIDGSYQERDGVIYSKSWVQFFVQEETSSYSIVDADGNLYDNTRRINTEGRYCVYIVDLAGNAVEANIVIDKTAPELHIETKSGRTLSGGAVNEAFRIVCSEEEADVTFAFADEKSVAYDGAWHDQEGSYTFTASDWLNNTASLTVIVSYGVAYEVSGTYIYRDGEYYSKNWLQLTPLEGTSLFTISNETGNFIDNTKKISEEGTYSAVIVDLAGNREEITLIIDKTAPVFEIQTESGKSLSESYITNESFRLECAEADCVVRFIYNKGVQLDYEGELLTEEGKYVFTLMDFLGNSTETAIDIDKSVSLTINGTYVNDGTYIYLSKTWLSVTLDEEMTVFVIDAPDGEEYLDGMKISSEGEYEIFAKDLYGNELSFKIVIDKTAPVITLTDVSNGGSTNTDVTVDVGDAIAAQYRYNGGDKLAVYSGTKFEKEGEYVIFAQDKVGNNATVEFAIDKHVDVLPSETVRNGQIITGILSFEFGESVKAVLSINGSESEYTRGVIAHAGEYILTVTDAVGNVKRYKWTIVPEKAREYCLPLYEGINVSVEKDGVIADVTVENGFLSLNENGKYLLRFTEIDASWTLEIEVDNLAPSVEFENTGKSVTISNPNKEDITYELYVNGVRKKFSLDSALTEVGSYRLVCTDSVGNVTEYSFELNYLSGVTIALISVVCALVIGGTVAIIVFRLKRRVF